MWPDCGDKLVSALRSEEWNFEESIWSVCLSDDADMPGLDLLFRWNPEEIQLKATANDRLATGKLEEVVVQFVQQVCWLSIVLSASPSDNSAKFHQAVVFQLGHGRSFNRLAQATLAFELMFLPVAGEEEESCWLNLYSNPILATGFHPVRERGVDYIGLEMSLEFMADLCGARHIVEFGGGIVIKGFSAMLLPIAYDPGLNIGESKEAGFLRIKPPPPHFVESIL